MLSLRFSQQASAVCCSRSSYMQFHKADLSLQDTTLQATLIHSQRSVSSNKYSLSLLQTAGETFFPPGTHVRTRSLCPPPITYTHILTSITFHSSRAVCNGINATSALSPHYQHFLLPIHTRAPRSLLLPGLGDRRADSSSSGRYAEPEGAPGRKRGERRPHVR